MFLVFFESMFTKKIFLFVNAFESFGNQVHEGLIQISEKYFLLVSLLEVHPLDWFLLLPYIFSKIN